MRTKGKRAIKGVLSAFAASILVGALGSAAMAQNNPVTRFDEGYLDQHPEVAQQLAGNPALVDNGQFMANHPGLREYFENHPQVRFDLKHHPYEFMSREDRLNNWRGRYWPGNWNGNNHPYPGGGWYQPYNGSGPHPFANTDQYLDHHPEVTQQLNQNPRLIDNPQYVHNHPGLHEFLENHPYARHEWRSHPYKFMGAEHQYDKHH
jgi:hypothetical protein